MRDAQLLTNVTRRLAIRVEQVELDTTGRAARTRCKARDAAKLVQVLTNPIVNSINYGNEGGQTVVRYYDAEDSILVEVADTGIGIREEHLPRVFERFYRVDKSRSRHAGGSGLGLAICKHIIETHGQTINVRSTYGEGSTFSFTLEKA